MSKTAYKDRWTDKVERFNKKFLPGTLVVYTSSGGIRFNTRIRYPAVILHNGYPVIWLENIAEYCSFTRVVVQYENT